MSCPICLEQLEKTNISITICNHTFCTTCLLMSIQKNTKCPLCRNELIKKKEPIRAQPILIEDLVDIIN